MISKSALATELRRRASHQSVISGLFPQQLKFVMDKSHFKLAKCSRRAGKSYACARYLLHEASTKAGANCAYLALTRKSAKRILWGLLKTLAAKHGIQINPKEAELVIEFPNGSMIHLLGANDEACTETLRGSPWDLVVIDEVASYRSHLESLIDEVVTPALLDHNGTIALIGTPSSDFTSFFYKANHDQSWASHAWTMFDNPHLNDPKSFLDSLMKKKGWTKDTPLVQREYYGLWCRSMSDQVYMYSPVQNRIDDIPENLNLRYVIGVDVGWKDDKAITVIGFNPDTSRKAYIVHKFKKSNMLISDLGVMLQSLNQKYAPTAIVIDPGGGGADISAEINARFCLHSTMAKKTAKYDYIEFMNAEYVAGHIVNVVDSDDDELEKEYQELQWADKEKRVEGPTANHLADSTLYAWREAYSFLYNQVELVPMTKEETLINLAREMEKQVMEQDEERLNAQREEEDWW